ncbi:MAG TPA: YkgJ family cysteine cluster protein [Desulfuromonadaceae bacterium]|jgi:Fe-S-cluster containining protein
MHLKNYRQLVERVDSLCNGITNALVEEITCRDGCSACCTSITVFPVEAAALRTALDSLPDEESIFVRNFIKEHAAGERCPLLYNHRCLLYAARPIICRTHGFPIQYTENDQQQVDCCPLNLEQCESLPGSVVIDLDRLNSVLVAVNALFLSQKESEGNLPDRLTIVEALLVSDSVQPA